MNIFYQKIIIEGCLLFKMYNEPYAEWNYNIHKYNINIIMHNNKYIVKLFIFRYCDW